MPIEKIDHLSVLEITGQDAKSFLQGQLTNDIHLADNKWQYSGYCNPKGRLLGLFTLWHSGDTIYTLVDSSLVEPLVKRLRMYVMRSKVEINTVQYSAYGVIGESSLLELAPDIDSEKANQKNSVLSNNDTHTLSYGNRYLCLVPADKNIHQAALVEKLVAKNESQWHEQNIIDGLPEVTSSSTEVFIPQMLNLDLLNGINFKKGCYTGQEIIARMHYLGKLKQRMFVCDLSDSNTELKPGDKIFSDDSLSKGVGNIVSINKNKALAVLRLDTLEQTNPSLWLTDDSTLSIAQEQPYSLEP